MKYMFALFLLSVGGGTIPLSAWTPAPCTENEAVAKTRTEFEKVVRSALPDTPAYVLHPFPTTEEEAVENFIEFHRRVFSDTASEALPTSEQRFFAMLDSDQLRVEVETVENWTPLRCGTAKARRTYSLIRFFETTTGVEHLRALVDDAGFVSQIGHRSEEQELPAMLSLGEARTAVRRTAVRKATEPQYVSTWGTLRCSALVPCVALRGDDDTLLVDSRSGSVFRISGESARRSFRETFSETERAGSVQRARASGMHLISLGADVVAIAEPLSSEAR